MQQLLYCGPTDRGTTLQNEQPGNLAPGIYAALYYTHYAFDSNFDAAGKETLFGVIEWRESYGIADCIVNIERCVGELNFTAVSGF